MTGTGHAEMEATTATGAQQTASGDRLEAQFASARAQARKDRERRSDRQGRANARRRRVQTASLDGHVVLLSSRRRQSRARSRSRRCAPRPGQRRLRGRRRVAAPDLNPRVGRWRSGADRGQDRCVAAIGRRLCARQREGDLVDARRCGAGRRGRRSASCRAAVALGGKGPAHVIAAEAQLNQADGRSHIPRARAAVAAGQFRGRRR